MATPPRTPPRSTSEGASPSRTSEPTTRAESPAHLVLRIVSIVLGLPLAVLAVAAWLAVLVESPWIALGLAAVILVLPSLLLVDRLLPEDDPRKARGLPTDVLSMLWLGVATLAFGPLGPWLHDPLVDLARRATGEELAASIASFVTGPVREAPRDEAASDAQAPTEETAEDAGAPS
jgi:hypothetical protein